MFTNFVILDILFITLFAINSLPLLKNNAKLYFFKSYHLDIYGCFYT